LFGCDASDAKRSHRRCHQAKSANVAGMAIPSVGEGVISMALQKCQAPFSPFA
jgi:hypothetical protein